MALPQNAQIDALFEAILKLEDREDCRLFLEDLCTIKEIQDMAQRFDTALMLDQGKKYSEIAGKVGASTATISRLLWPAICMKGIRTRALIMAGAPMENPAI